MNAGGDQIVIQSGGLGEPAPIEQSFRPQESDIHTVIGRGEMVKVRGNLLPETKGRRNLSIETAKSDVEAGDFCMMMPDMDADEPA